MEAVSERLCFRMVLSCFERHSQPKISQLWAPGLLERGLGSIVKSIESQAARVAEGQLRMCRTVADSANVMQWSSPG